jgi:hypothetical protein
MNAITREQKLERYRALCHAVQTGIGWEIARENPACVDINADPNLRYHKHLRTGIDVTKSDQGSLVALLIEKGVITDDEYLDAIVAGMEREKALYEQSLSEYMGTPIKLG